MDKREQIIPARFDYKDAAAGLRAIEESGQVAGDLGQAADEASARFRKAHESVQSALQEFVRLGRSLQLAPGHEPGPTAGAIAANDAGRGAATRLSPAEWLGSQAELAGEAGVRRSTLGMASADEQAGGLPQGSPGLAEAREIRSQGDNGRSSQVSGRGSRGIASDAQLPTAGGTPGSSGAPPEGDILLRAIEGAKYRGFGGELGMEGDNGRSGSAGPFADRLKRPGAPGQDLEAFQRKGEILADIRLRQGLAGGVGDPGTRPGQSGQPDRVPQGAIAGYVEWRTGDREDSRDRVAAAQRAGTVTAVAHQRDRQALRGETEAWNRSGGPSGSPDPREGIRRTRASSPFAAPVDESLPHDRTMQPSREMGGVSPRGLEPGARLGGLSTGVIERLLREQNELIRQDLQRNSHPPIAAPPPMRGGGVRM
jgi:hypothetical protein